MGQGDQQANVTQAAVSQTSVVGDRSGWSIPSCLPSLSRGNFGRFDLPLARAAAQLAASTYDHAMIDTALAHASIWETDTAIYVCFRGSKSVRDFITDGELKRVKRGEFEIHEGFYHATTSIMPQIIGRVIGAKPVIYIGHSLGGALAILAAWLASKIVVCTPGASGLAHSVYTFGCPRVGDAAFQANYDLFLRSRTFNVINDVDIVPRVPGRVMGYHRPGTDIFIPENSTSYWIDPSLVRRLGSDARSLFRGWLATRNPLVLDELLADHHIGQYINALNLLN